MHLGVADHAVGQTNRRNALPLPPPAATIVPSQPSSVAQGRSSSDRLLVAERPDNLELNCLGAGSTSEISVALTQFFTRPLILPGDAAESSATSVSGPQLGRSSSALPTKNASAASAPSGSMSAAMRPIGSVPPSACGKSVENA